MKKEEKQEQEQEKAKKEKIEDENISKFMAGLSEEAREFLMVIISENLTNPKFETVFQTQTYLISYFLNLRGHSARQMSMDYPQFQSRTVISERMNNGRALFFSLSPLFALIEKKLIEKGIWNKEMLKNGLNPDDTLYMPKFLLNNADNTTEQEGEHGEITEKSGKRQLQVG